VPPPQPRKPTRASRGSSHEGMFVPAKIFYAMFDLPMPKRPGARQSTTLVQQSNPWSN
jgi:hypothetical protein